MHQLIGERALPADLPTGLVPPTPADVDALRRATWRAGATHRDAAVRERFLRRYPTEEGFDAWAWKELLGLTPEARVGGIDRLPAPEGGAREIAARASRDPDDDERNVERFAHDERRAVRRDAAGRPLPADPEQLDMGALTGLSSQAHAHYGLLPGPLSDAPAVLREAPWRFAWPPTARAFAPEFAQAHTDVALAAAAGGTPGGEALGWIWLGASEHYLEDVANQIHDLQAIYPFFVDAKLESLKEDVLSLGGRLRPRQGFVEIGLGIIKNHHLFLEDLWAKRVREAVEGKPASPAVAAALARLPEGDPVLERELDASQLDPYGPFARSLGEALVEASAPEGAEVYAAARDIARRRLSRAGFVFEGDPDLQVRPDATPAQRDRFYELEGRGLARAATAIRRQAALYRAALAEAGDEEGRRALQRHAMERVVAWGVTGLDAREERLRAWLARPPAPEAGGVPPGAVAALLAAVALGTALLARRARRRR
jgi:hypothetical protein